MTGVLLLHGGCLAFDGEQPVADGEQGIQLVGDLRFAYLHGRGPGADLFVGLHFIQRHPYIFLEPETIAPAPGRLGREMEVAVAALHHAGLFAQGQQGRPGGGGRGPVFRHEWAALCLLGTGIEALQGPLPFVAPGADQLQQGPQQGATLRRYGGLIK